MIGGDFTQITKPCPDPQCNRGWNDREDWYCQTCKGTTEIEIEVHSCGKEGSGNDPCRCFEDASVQRAA